MLERYGHCAKHCSTCNNCANKPGFLRHDVLPLDCRTLERIFPIGPVANDSGIERKRVLSAVCSRKNRQNDGGTCRSCFSRERSRLDGAIRIYTLLGGDGHRDRPGRFGCLCLLHGDRRRCVGWHRAHHRFCRPGLADRPGDLVLSRCPLRKTPARGRPIACRALIVGGRESR